MTREEYLTKLKETIEEVVPCQDCGGYVSDHQGVQGDCNYEAGTEIVDQTVIAIQTLNDEAIGEDMEIDYSFGVGDDRPDIKNESKQEIRNIIGSKR